MSCAELQVGNTHPKTAAKKHLDIERGGGFQYQGDPPDPMCDPYVGSGFHISEQYDILDPHYRSTKFNAKSGKNGRRLQGLQALQCCQERKSRHKKLHPYRVALIQGHVVCKLCAQHTLKK
jgi:hypothetical protein